MVAVTISGTEAMTRRLLELGADAPRAATRAVNRTLGSVMTATVRALAENTGLRNKDVTPVIGLVRATFRRPVASLQVTGRRIPLIAFGARGPEPSRGKGSGVTYRLPGGKGRRDDAFIATMRSGRRGVFVRSSLGMDRKSRGAWGPNLPIKELRGPSLPGAMVRAGIYEAQQRNAATLLDKNLNHEINWISSQRIQDGDGSEGAA